MWKRNRKRVAGSIISIGMGCLVAFSWTQPGEARGTSPVLASLAQTPAEPTGWVTPPGTPDTYDPLIEPDGGLHVSDPGDGLVPPTMLENVTGPTIASWPNAPMAIPSSGYIGYTQGRNGHNGVDIWSYNGQSGSPPGNEVRLAYSGCLRNIQADYQGHKNALIFEHDIAQSFSPYVPLLHVYTLYFHMARDGGPVTETYIDPAMVVGQCYGMGTVIGHQGNARYAADEDVVTHLHFCVSSTKSCAQRLDIDAYLGPDLTYPAPPSWMQQIQYNGPGGASPDCSSYVYDFSFNPPSPSSATNVSAHASFGTGFPSFRAARIRVVGGDQICEQSSFDFTCNWNTQSTSDGDHNLILEIDDTIGSSWDNPQTCTVPYHLNARPSPATNTPTPTPPAASTNTPTPAPACTGASSLSRPGHNVLKSPF